MGIGSRLYGEDQAKPWVESRLHELRHGQEGKFLAKVALALIRCCR